MSDPILDRSKPFGEIHHGFVPDGVQVSEMVRYTQDGHNFLPNGKYHSSNPGAKKVAVQTVPPLVSRADVQTRPGVDESQVKDLLSDPRAEQLLLMPRDHLIMLVNAANGPVYAGEGSTQLMVAWLVSNTEGPAPAPPPAPLPAPVPVRTIIQQPTQPTIDDQLRSDDDPL